MRREREIAYPSDRRGRNCDPDMDPFPFTDDLLTGLEEIDSQHRKLFELANRIADPSPPVAVDSTLLGSLAFLSEYVEEHFVAEELAMQEAAYPELTQHVKEHVELRKTIAGLLESALLVPSLDELKPALNDVVVGWLCGHIRVTDKAMAVHLRQLAEARVKPSQ